MSTKALTENLLGIATVIDSTPDIPAPESVNLSWHCKTSEQVIDLLKAFGIDGWEWKRLGSGRSRSWLLVRGWLSATGQLNIFVPEHGGDKSVRRFILEVREAQRAERIAPMTEFAKGTASA